MDGNGTFDTIIAALAGITTTISAWIIARRRNNAEAKTIEVQADGSELANVEKAIALWRESAEGWKKERDQLHNEHQALKEQYGLMKLEYMALKTSLSEIEKRLAALVEENTALRAEVERLKK